MWMLKMGVNHHVDVKNGCEPPCGFYEMNSDPLQEQ